MPKQFKYKKKIFQIKFSMHYNLNTIRKHENNMKTIIPQKEYNFKLYNINIII